MMRRLVWLTVTGLAISGMGGRAEGQVLHVNRDKIPPVDSMFRIFIRYYESIGRPGEGPPNPGPAPAVLFAPNEWGRELVEPVLKGFEDLALNADSAFVRTAAVSWLISAGDAGDIGTGLRLMDGVGRLQRVFDQSQDEGVRTAIIDRMWSQANQPAAVAFLTDVAGSNRPQDRGSDWPEPYLAVNALGKMGDRGAAVLRELRAGGRVKNGRGRGLLELLARRNYRWQ